MPEEGNIWVDLSALAALLSVVAYALFGGADFGGGVWDFFAAGERKKAQRLAIQQAMGPVWEANHVWLIFCVVILFTCFPRGYSLLGIALFAPFHLALLGIMLRGASFVFRSYQSLQEEAAATTSAWGVVFGAASIISPILLGAAFGVVTEGQIHADVEKGVVLETRAPWSSPYAVANGLLALSTCAYLAAVYLTNETEGLLREDFRRRAIVAGTSTALLSALVLVLAIAEARWFLDRLLSWKTAPVIAAGLFCFAGSAWAVFRRRYRLSRIYAAAEIVLLLVGWGMAQYPYLIYPGLTFDDAAAPTATLRFVILSLAIACVLLIPSLFFLFHVFKGAHRDERRRPEA